MKAKATNSSIIIYCAFFFSLILIPQLFNTKISHIEKGFKKLDWGGVAVMV